ncbi:MAG: iron ABC transporter permease [Methanobrevibacter sp.]|nr:iron ABC transporter permease [Methanobrevibacter sp.]
MSKHSISAITLLLMLLIALFFISFLLGRYPISPYEVILAICSKITGIDFGLSQTVETIIFQIRLPRILAAILVGASLSIAGASFQGLFKNPLVSPDKLGVSSGAGFGAALAILLYGGYFLIQALSFIFGLLAVVVSYLLSRTFKGTSMLTLVLCGIAIGSFFSALLSIAKYVADPYGQLPTIVFWLMGSLASVTTQQIIMVLIPMLIGITILILIRWRLNVVSMGDEEALTMGIDVKKMQAIIIICCTLITAAAVSISGIIGWIGLVIPHIARMILGPDHKVLLPASVILGAFFLLLIDNISRTVTTVEIPLGILTALIGAPFFIYLLKKSKEVWV